MTAKFLKIFLLVLVVINCCDCKKYYNYTLFRSLPRTDIHLNFLRNLESNPSFNFWTYPGSHRMPVDFVAGIESQSRLVNEAEKIGLPLTTVNENIQSAFDMQITKDYTRFNVDTFNWNNYFRLNDIYIWLEDLAKQFPNEIKLLSIGNTQQNRNIMGVRIALNESLRSKVIIEGGIHAREWISPAFVTCLIDKILHAPTSDDKKLKNIAYTYEWYLVPVLNPDGYEFSHTKDRLWSKNRNRQGVDLNRNFAHKFGSHQVSKDKNSQVYCGPRPLSEPESWSLADFIRAKSTGLEYYLAIHSYGQHLVLPEEDPEDKWNLYVRKKCRKAADRITARYDIQYNVGTGEEIYGYKTSGSSASWVKNEFNVPFVVTFALRDEGKYGFALPPDQIMPTCLETIDGLVSLLTPETKTFNASLREVPIPEPVKSGQVFSILDKFVIVFNMFLFIIVRLE